MKENSSFSFWMFVLPITALFAMVVLIPFFSGIYYSFTDWKAMPGIKANWVGLDNFVRMTQDEHFFQSLISTLVYLVYSVVLINIIGFFLAILVTRPLKACNFFRASFFIPNMIGGLLLGYVWKFVFLQIFPDLYKLTEFFFFKPPWLGETNQGIWAMAIVSTWQMGGYIMVIYIAGIQAVPDEYYEAAKIDGASSMRSLYHITLPLLAPAFTVNLFLTLSYGFKMFDVNISLTGGDPARTTELLAMNLFQTAFTLSEFGYAQALSLIFMLLIAVVTLTQVYFSKKRELEL